MPISSRHHRSPDELVSELSTEPDANMFTYYVCGVEKLTCLEYMSLSAFLLLGYICSNSPELCIYADNVPTSTEK